MATAKKPPIDPLDSPKIALAGRIVTMDANFTVLDGTIYMENGNISAVVKKGQPAPAAFTGVDVVDTHGTIFPGFIELHNHLAYNALRLWNVPLKYGDRGQWQRSAQYHNLVSGPMMVLGKTEGIVPAIVRYVECKSLFGGVTTSQGIRLVSNASTPSFFVGLVRNVENTGDPTLPNAGALIADADSKDPKKFLQDLKSKKCYLIHLSEGVDDAARKHFLALQFAPGQWAIASSLAGVHCNGLLKEDFHEMGTRGASMVWSPLSNLLLYGGTARVADAISENVRVGIGSDWSPSGSKNLLGEMKVAKVYSENSGNFVKDRDIVAMATSNAAAILGWGTQLGSIEVNKRADLAVWAGTSDDSYGALIKSHEADLQLVVINGVARYGVPALMTKLGASAGESVKVGGQTRTLFLKQATASAPVAALTLDEATDTLTAAMKDLPNHSSSPAFHSPHRLMARTSRGTETFTLALDEISATGMDLRPHLPYRGQLTMPVAKGGLLAATALPSLKLDPLTVVDDPDFLNAIDVEKNLPDFISPGLRALY
jgi:5-methylthioadenosine/S-adenosylhomocysteine deaminase